ncbi:MAG: DUF6600 domain-containing protein [Pyrinomonadaceae bacterium]
MGTTGKVLWSAVFALILLMGNSIFVCAGARARTLNLPEAGSNNAIPDDEVPEVTARVARISFLNGEAKIRRSGGGEWEKVTLNLPVVEGDEIATETNARVEIQFDKNQHLRLAGNSYLKIVNLKDAGIAVSLSLGTLSLRITSFNKDSSFFEIDAPKTTLAIQRSGSYRIDAGKEGDSEVRIAATDGGEARIYSDNAGFTVKNGRSARIFIDGATAGEWEATDASRYSDDFDRWSADRDSTIARRLKDAYYDKYYDNDIYGADDLTDNGDWAYTKDYGYVWRPYQTTLSGYVDWSPYRYGHWRWMPPYGWIWVNDEPWGWATYHHGRWFYDNGRWCWSPYGYYRPSRSWWSGALVAITIVSNNICWYPLSYHQANYNYNWRYYHRDNRGRRDDDRRPPGPRPRPGDRGGAGDQNDHVPAVGVVAVASSDFGTRANGNRRATSDIARMVLSQKHDEQNTADLPAYTAMNRRIGREIMAERPSVDITERPIKVGAADRHSDKPLDTELRTTRVFGGRPPQRGNDDPAGGQINNGGPIEPRRTGAVERAPVVEPNDDRPAGQRPVHTQRETPRISDSPRFGPPAEQETPQNNPPVQRVPPMREPPHSEPPTAKEKPNDSPPPQRVPPRREPPQPSEKPSNDPPPHREPPRSEPPQRQSPKSEPPVRSEPKPEHSPSRPPDTPRPQSPKDGS